MNQTHLTPSREGGNATFLWMIAIVLAIVVVDQIIKIYVKTHFYLGEDLAITDWMHIKFIENPGMALGMNFIPKVLLTSGRIVAVACLVWVLWRLCRENGLRTGFLVVLALITAGAAGNIFDCVFYGQIFNNPVPPEIAQAFGTGTPYADWFHGRVVDMFYFPLFDFVWPDWMPVVGGTQFEFFSYIFNFADASICVGVALLIIFYRKDADKALNFLFGKTDGLEDSVKK